VFVFAAEVCGLAAKQAFCGSSDAALIGGLWPQGTVERGCLLLSTTLGSLWLGL